MVKSGGALGERIAVELGRAALREAAFDHAPDAMIVCDDDGVFVDCNAAATTLFGVERTALLGRRVGDFAAVGYESAGRWRQFLATGSTAGRFPLRSADGRKRMLAVSAVTNVVAGRHLAIVRDATALHEAEVARQMLVAIFDSSRDAMFAADDSGVITIWNRAAEKLFGYPAGEAIGRDSRVLVPAELRADHEHTLRRVRSGERIEGVETTRLTRDGRRIEVALALSPLHDDAGRPVGSSAIVSDLTDRRRVEKALARYEEQLRQAQKMEAIGQLAGGVAHDFNNLLAVILTYSELALQSASADGDLRDDIEEIRKAAIRSTELTQHLLAFSRKQVLKPVVADPNASLRGLERVLRRVVGEHIELTLALAPTIGRIRVDQGQFEQVVLNLVSNARDAMPYGGRLSIESSNVDLDSQYAASHIDVQPGSYVLVAVSDTGVGMDRETLTRIFEPFFTTKGPGKGTGLGLSSVYGIVHQSGGHVWAYSELGRGTTFKLFFPRADGRPSQTFALAAPRGALQGSEAVLLVEDDEHLRNAVHAILRRNGYRVVVASDGMDALRAASEPNTAIDAIVTDVVMPRMNGPQLVDQLRASRPNARVLFVSGYTDHAVVQNGVLEPGVNFLQKPFTPEALLKMLRSILER